MSSSGSNMTPAQTHMEAQLRAFYAEHNPGNDQNIAEIVRKFAGREHVLCAKLRKKYGVAPDLSGAASAERGVARASVSSSVPAAAPAAAAPPQQQQEPSPSRPAHPYDPSFQAFVAPPSSDSPLDHRSSAFDPLQALRQRECLPHLTPTQPLDNIAKCRYLLPVSDPHHQKPTVLQPSKKTAGDTVDAKKSVPSRPDAAPTLFERLADTYLDGPFSVLRRCFLERKRVVAVVRRVNSVRGTCAGYLKAFDKHMNLVLMDVTEQSVALATHARQLEDVRAGRVPLSATLFSVADPKRNRSVALYHKQLFVRGDNVVMVLEEPLGQRLRLRGSGDRRAGRTGDRSA